jgi:hypothetical protein
MKSMTQAATKNVDNAARSTRRARIALSAPSLMSFTALARFALAKPPIHKTFIKCVGSIP